MPLHASAGRLPLRLLGLLFLCACAAPVFAQPAADWVHVPFDDPAWNLEEATGAAVVEIEGRTSLYFERGEAVLDGVTFGDGVIEVDVRSSAPQAFGGVIFRVQAPGEYEDVYLRFHKSRSPDAVQYAPTFGGLTAWQLHGPGDGWGTTAFDPDAWQTLRVEVAGEQVRVFAGQSDDPVLHTTLRREERTGGLGIWCLLGAYFSNFRYTPAVPSFEPLAAPEPEQGVIRSWRVAFAPADAPADRLIEPDTWRRVTSEPNGLVNLSKFLPHPTEGDIPTALARTVLRSDRAQTVPLHIGYSDDVVVFLNGAPVFSGRSGFRARDPLFQGMIGYHDTLYLSLEAGDNDLVFAVSEVFGGWGLMAKTEAAAGLTFP